MSTLQTKKEALLLEMGPYMARRLFLSPFVQRREMAYPVPTRSQPSTETHSTTCPTFSTGGRTKVPRILPELTSQEESCRTVYAPIAVKGLTGAKGDHDGCSYFMHGFQS